jgi:hypothetical protein
MIEADSAIAEQDRAPRARGGKNPEAEHSLVKFGIQAIIMAENCDVIDARKHPVASIGLSRIGPNRPAIPSTDP